MTSTQTSEAPAVALPAFGTAAPQWERWALWLVLAVSAACGFNHIHTNTVFGQDIGLHTFGTEEMLKDPHQWFPQDFTNRPMIYWLGVAGHWLTHGKAPYETAMIMCVLLNTLALFFVHDSTRSFIRSPWLRISAVAFIAFLPTTQVSLVVYAGDAVGPFPFALSIWALLRSLEAVSTRACLGYAVVATLGLCLGNFSRFPFIILPVAVLVAILLAWHWDRLSWRRALMIGALTLIAPTLTGAWLNRLAEREIKDKGIPEHHTHDWNGTGEMSWRYLLWVKKSDVRIFDAPGYWDHDEKGEATLPVVHNYTYPALFHLGIYTDVLDYANDGSFDNGQPRPEPQKTLCRWAVRLGLVTTVAAIVALLSLVIRSAIALFTRRNAPPTGAAVWGLMALAWYLPIVLAFPYVHYVYESGYFLTRIVIPALWGFGVVLFAAVDQWLAPRPRWSAVLVAVLILAQAAIHIRSVWY